MTLTTYHAPLDYERKPAVLFQLLLADFCAAARDMQEGSLTRLVGEQFLDRTGSLTRLKRTSDLLAEVAPFAALRDIVNQVWLLAMAGSPDLKRAFDGLVLAIPLAFTAFREDENVLFFTIRHARSFSGIYGAGFLQRWVPMRVDALEAFLIKRYEERGFEELQPQISEAIAAL